jgi:hypothetical protein
MRSWCEDGHPDEDRYRRHGWNPVWHTNSKAAILAWVKEYNDKPKKTEPKEREIPDEIVTEERQNGVDGRSIDPDGNHSEDLEHNKTVNNPYNRRFERKFRSQDEERRWVTDDERPQSFWERNRLNLKQQFEREVDQYGTPTKDHHTKKMPVTPGTAERKRQMAA